jgi:hypothetical protein
LWPSARVTDGPTLPFGVQLLEHRVARRLVEVDIEDLGPRHLDPPVIDGTGHAQLDRLDQGGAVGLDLVELHLADLGPDDARDRGGDGGVHVADAVDRLFRFEDAVEDARVHLHQHVVERDGVLARGRELAFEDRNLVRHPVEEGDDEVDAGPSTAQGGRSVRPRAFPTAARSGRQARCRR